MTVPNLFCQRAANGEVLRVLEDRPMAFIHVRDAAAALVRAAATCSEAWQVVNAAPEVATIGQVARIVRKLATERGIEVRTEGAIADEVRSFRVRSRVKCDAPWTLETGLDEVFEYFRTNS
jgi:nucleoside-diphosphate-sugar epimerase